MDYFKFFGLMAFSGLMFAACSEDDDNSPSPIIDPVEPADCAYILGTGNEGYGINGEIAFYNAATDTVTNGLFAAANGRELGMTPNDMKLNMAHGEMCIAVTSSNVIEFTDYASMKSIAHIELADSSYGGPRHVMYTADNAFVTMKSGHLVRIELNSHRIDGVAHLQALEGSYAGTYPEGMAVGTDGLIYVALSGMGDGIENRVAVVDPGTMAVERYITVASNLTDVIVADGHIYALSAGYYDAADGYAQKEAGLYEFTSGATAVKVCDATMVATCKDAIYYINAPYGAQQTSLGVFTPADGKNTTLASPAPGASPTALGVSLSKSYLLIGSYRMGENGYASYDTQGYIIRYNIGSGETKEYDTEVYGINSFLFM